MSNVRVTWTLPTKRVNGKALPASEIAQSIVSLSADGGAHFGELTRIDAPGHSFLQTELEPGTYVFRVVVVDKSQPDPLFSLPSNPGSVTIAQTSPPAAVTDLTVVVE